MERRTELSDISRSAKRVSVHLLCAVTALAIDASTSSESLAAQAAETVARVSIVNKSLELLDGSSWRTVYSPDVGWISNVAVSRDGRLMAFLHWTPGVVSGHDYTVPPEPALFLVDRAGKPQTEPVRGIQRFVWCGPTRLAAIRGTYWEGAFPPFRPDRVLLLDLGAPGSGSLVLDSITSVPAPIDLACPSFEPALYLVNATPIDGAQVFRYVFATGQLGASTVLRPDFSPTGNFYLVHWPLSDSVSVFESRTNRVALVAKTRSFGQVLRWVYESGDYLLVLAPGPVGKPYVQGDKRPKGRVILGPIDRDYLIYDVTKGRQFAARRMKVQPASAPGNAVVVTIGGSTSVLRRP